MDSWIHNPTCKHIFFAGCHDNGYLITLERFKHDKTVAQRITLVEAALFRSGFSELLHHDFRSICFNSIFRKDELPDAAPRLPPVSTRPTSPPQTMVPATAHPTSRAPSAPALDSSWAAVGKTGVTMRMIPMGSFKAAPAPEKKYILTNAAGQRLDPPLPPRDSNAKFRLEELRDQGKKLCNSYHLNRGKCHSGARCPYKHEPKLNDKEIIALRYLSRGIFCATFCEDFDCYQGHQCPTERDRGSCGFGRECHFRHVHGMDKVSSGWRPGQDVAHAPRCRTSKHMKTVRSSSSPESALRWALVVRSAASWTISPSQGMAEIDLKCVLWP